MQLYSFQLFSNYTFWPNEIGSMLYEHQLTGTSYNPLILLSCLMASFSATVFFFHQTAHWCCQKLQRHIGEREHELLFISLLILLGCAIIVGVYKYFVSFIHMNYLDRFFHLGMCLSVSEGFDYKG